MFSGRQDKKTFGNDVGWELKLRFHLYPCQCQHWLQSPSLEKNVWCFISRVTAIYLAFVSVDPAMYPYVEWNPTTEVRRAGKAGRNIRESRWHASHWGLLKKDIPSCICHKISFRRMLLSVYLLKPRCQLNNPSPYSIWLSQSQCYIFVGTWSDLAT